jgi:hypothetical protein
MAGQDPLYVLMQARNGEARNARPTDRPRVFAAVAAAVAFAFPLTACVAIGNAQNALGPTGTFTDMRYHRESGDVVGTEVSIACSRGL